LAQPTVKVGDVWVIPVNTGDISLGLTGEVTLTFADTQAITVPAGTFQTMKIEITSTILSVHSDSNTRNGSLINILAGMSTQINGTSYIELGTCRLIKADLIHIVSLDASGIVQKSTTEQILMEYTKP